MIAKDNSFYYRDSSKFLDVTVYYTKTNTLVPGEIMEQDMHIRHYVICCYCIMIAIIINVRFRFSIYNTTRH